MINRLDSKTALESAFVAYLEPLVPAGDLTGFQIVYRFFTGRLTAPRLSVMVDGSPTVELRAESGEAITWSAGVAVELTTDRKYQERHEDAVQAVAARLYDTTELKAAINEQASETNLNLFFWEPDGERVDEARDKMQVTRITGRALYGAAWS